MADVISQIEDLTHISDVADHFIELVRKFAPHDWVGNHDDGGKHFDSITKIDFAPNFKTQKFWVKAVYVEDGVTKRVQMWQPWLHFGKGDAEVVLENNNGFSAHGGFVLAPKAGVFGLHIAATFKYTDAAGKAQRLRFDGKVVG